MSLKSSFFRTQHIVSTNAKQLVKVILHKAALPPHMDGSVVVAR